MAWVVERMPSMCKALVPPKGREGEKEGRKEGNKLKW
jgi:hypothetical protein